MFLMNLNKLTEENRILIKDRIKIIIKDLKKNHDVYHRRDVIFYYFPLVYNPIQTLLSFGNDNLIAFKGSFDYK